MAVYFGTTINDSPTIVLPANAAITGAQGKAAVVTSGKIKIADTAGAAVIGVIPLSEDDDIAAGADVTVQIKDIGVWIAGEAIAIGDELTTDAYGKAVKAAAGDFVVGVALSAAAAAGTRISFQMTKSGYKAAGLKLSDLADVTLTTPANTEVLKYDGTKWVNGTDAT